MKDILIFAAVLAGWIVLNMWVLPFFGIRTCMSGGCRVTDMRPTEMQGQDSQVTPEAPASPERVSH